MWGVWLVLADEVVSGNTSIISELKHLRANVPSPFSLFSVSRRGKSPFSDDRCLRLKCRVKAGKLFDSLSHSVERAALKSPWDTTLHAFEMCRFVCYHWNTGVICDCTVASPIRVVDAFNTLNSQFLDLFSSSYLGSHLTSAIHSLACILVATHNCILCIN